MHLPRPAQIEVRADAIVLTQESAPRTQVSLLSTGLQEERGETNWGVPKFGHTPQYPTHLRGTTLRKTQ